VGSVPVEGDVGCIVKRSVAKARSAHVIAGSLSLNQGVRRLVSAKGKRMIYRSIYEKIKKLGSHIGQQKIRSL
ncbi:MAG: hypothetical protein ACYTAS_13510, partial [Planctomycetota bacterium]